MELRRIELEGFKSFADRTVLPVQQGLTGIVGPNGCGKSNVVDALLWVMGERSARALRAEAMDDVIFKGAEGRKAAPFAMVEVILGDIEGKFGEPGGELAVGRRLFRSGESEYLLQGRKVKLQEVRDMIMDTGLGVRSYMVLAQGKIDAVLSANPADRRSVFEEAAGISRYKARKHKAELKLTRVGQDLERVDDILREVSRSVRSLRSQAGKAQRHIELRDSWRLARVRYALARRAQLATEENAIAEQASTLETAIEELRQARTESDGRLSELGAEEATLRERRDAIRVETAEARQKAAALEERVRGLETRGSDFQQRVASERARLVQIETEVSDLEKEADRLQAEEFGLQESGSRLAAALDASEATYAEARKVQQQAREQVDSLRSGVLSALGERTDWQNRAAAAASTRSEAEGAVRALERREAACSQEQEAAQLELQEASTARAKASASVGQLEGTSRDWLQERDLAREALASASRELQEAERQETDSRTLLETLDAVDQDLRGVPESVRELLLEPVPGVHGPVLSGIRVAPPWDRLLENLLGRLQHAIWVDAPSTLDKFKGEVDWFHPGANHVPVEIQGARALRSVLEGDASRCDAVCARLGPVYCVEDFSTAQRLSKSNPGALFLSSDGSMLGAGYGRRGMLEAQSGAGMLARENVRRQAQADLKSSQEGAQVASQEEEKARLRLDQSELKLQASDRDLRAAVAERDRAEARTQEAQERLARRQEESQALAQERARANETVLEGAALEQESIAGRDKSEALRLQRDGELNQAEEVAETAAASLETVRLALTESRLSYERHEQSLETRAHRMASLRRQLEKDGQTRTELAGGIAQAERSSQQSLAQAEEDRTEVSALLTRRGDLEERLAEAEIQLQRAGEVLEGVRLGEEKGTDRLETFLGNRQELALAEQRITMQREELLRALGEEFPQSLDLLAASLELDPTGKEDLAAVETLESESSGLRLELDRLGSVNLEAVAELSDREERERFLTGEREDLNAANAELLSTIEELDQLCRVRFVETFDAVAGQFEAIFRRLFRGGRASVTLEEGTDPLTAGIDINVRPPGKDLRSIKLLSGGERTLTALALLLAVFRSRPSPFCLLDEVDAALDDANVGRFLDVLADFVKDTQFLVVTHNKLTMARCQRLFGVTMRKAGISLVVGVDLSDLEKEGLVDDPSQESKGSGQEDPSPDRSGSDAPPPSARASGLEFSN